QFSVGRGADARLLRARYRRGRISARVRTTPAAPVYAMRLIFLFVLVSCLSLVAVAQESAMPAEEAAASMKLPPDFKATVFAAEPAITQPMAFTFDDRGRVWVVENFSYPSWRSDNTGHDRVTILEDTDGDGRHDKRTE